jgi:Uma2 family endonuclease
MDVEEYLHTRFDGADCEPHSDVQVKLGSRLRTLRHKFGIRVLTESLRVADLAVWRSDDIGTGIPTVAPFLAIEIVSPEYRPEDSIVRMVVRIQEYLSIGVEYVWVIDPQEKAAICFSKLNPRGSVCDVLRTENPDIEIPVASAFDLDA